MKIAAGSTRQSAERPCRYVKDELSYDRYHEKAGRIYRADFKGTVFGQDFDMTEVGGPFGPTVLADFPEVEQQVRLRGRGSFLMNSLTGFPG